MLYFRKHSDSHSELLSYAVWCLVHFWTSLSYYSHRNLAVLYLCKCTDVEHAFISSDHWPKNVVFKKTQRATVVYELLSYITCIQQAKVF